MNKQREMETNAKKSEDYYEKMKKEGDNNF